MTDRRTFVCSTAFGVFAVALAANAQRSDRLPRVGILSSAATPQGTDETRLAWTRFMREAGWVEGQNIVFERRYSDGKLDLLAEFAQEFVQTKVDVIGVFSSSDAGVAKRATSTIPIVMVFSGIDPVREGFIASFARPGGNITGVSRMLAETRAKRLEMIKAMVPAASRIGVLASPQPDAARQAEFESTLRSAARAIQVELHFHLYRNQDELVAALPAMAAARMDAFLLEPTFQTFANRGRIAERALQLRLPGVFTLGQYAVAGGLLSYGPEWTGIVQQHARFVDRIVRGAKPDDLPMEQPTKFELVINNKTAKALGITIPLSLLLRADKVIQ
jgi:putative ABC transport system substrate-binding protein